MQTTAAALTLTHYHAENGRFSDNDFIKDLKAHVQTTTYCRVNSYYQKGKAEKRIGDFQERTRIVL